MNNSEGPRSATPQTGVEPPDQGQSVPQAEIDAVLDSFKRLVQAVADGGRDWKLVDAILRTMIHLVMETEGDVFISAESPANEPSTAREMSTRAIDDAVELPRRLRPKYRLRFEAVIDSWSDDETAEFLSVGPRQVRRLAQQGALYYFHVDRKRRYPVWQFDTRFRVLSGVSSVGRSLPEAWPPERVYAFMTTPSSNLGRLTPAQWLLANCDTDQLVAQIKKISKP